MFARKTRQLAGFIACLSLPLLSGVPDVGAFEENRAFIENTIILTQNSSSSKDTNLDQLKTRGARIIDYSNVRELVNRGRTEKGGIACVGAKQCLILIDNFGSQCKSFVCGNDNGKPVCWCDT